MPRIRPLEDRLISQIAAGEVVERPASVVKELVENALDADSSAVRIELEGGGRRLVRVVDDGWGMDAEDALLAFDRHATSKIARFEDLEQLATLGFRGEALAAVAAVSKVSLKTAREAGQGCHVRVEGGRVVAQEPAGCPRGTDIEVASLFWNVPARRKFLKTPATELRRSIEVVHGYALGRPDVRFELSHEGRRLLTASPTTGDLSNVRRQRLAQLYGSKWVDDLVDIPSATEAGGAGGIHGFVGRSRSGRGRRLVILVNGRLVRDRTVLGVFYRSVREQGAGEEAPALFLYLDLPPEEVDVNVHPQKSEVRFRDPAFLTTLRRVFRAALEKARGDEPISARPTSWVRGSPIWQERRGDLPQLAYRSPTDGGQEVREEPALLPPQQGRLAGVSYSPPAGSPLSGRGRGDGLRVVGQYKGSLILLEGADALYLVDQHAAHERILYEQIRRSLKTEVASSQPLLEPLVLELSVAEAAALGEMSDVLESAGFSLRGLSGSSVAVTALPTGLDADSAAELLHRLSADTVGEAAKEVLEQRLLEAYAANRACKSAIKIHHPLSLDKMERLIGDLFLCEQPYSCPHGRPVLLSLSDPELERRFGRRG